MRIMGKNNDKFIVQLSNREIAHVLGFSSEHQNGFDYAIGSGMSYGEVDIPISRIYDTHSAIEYIKKQERIIEIVKQLKSIVKALEPMESVVKEIPTVEKE